MPFSLDIDQNARLIRVTYSGNFNTQDRTHAMHQVIAQLENHPDYHVLIDNSKGTETSTEEEKVDFGEFMAPFYLRFEGIKIAVLSQDSSHPNIVVSASFIQGLENICEFYNENDALHWLSQ